MILSSSDTIEVVLGEAKTTNDCPYTVGYFDSGATPAGGPLLGNTNGTTTVTPVTAPASGYTRQVFEFTLFNADTVSHAVTVQYNNSSTTYKIIKGTLQAGETLAYSAHTGWRVLDANGNLKAAAVYTRGQIIGTNTNDNASAGNVGEYLSATTSTATNINTATATDIGNIALTAGDWDVRVWAKFSLGTGTVAWTRGIAGTSITSATLDTSLGRVIEVPGAGVSAAVADIIVNLAGERWSEASSLTLYGIAYVEYTGGGQAQFTGQITARRVR